MSRCSSCNQEIIWIKLKSGKYNPVDPYLRTIVKDDGKETLITKDGEIIHGRFESLDDGANASGYISHFATCPNAHIHRRRS